MIYGFAPWVRWLAAPLVAVILVLPAVGLAADRHAGYYYPVPQSTEVYQARAETLSDSNRRRRVLFVTELTNQMMSSPYPPPYALFAKGEQAEKMIITALEANRLNTLYRMRALLAMLTARARSTDLFRGFEAEDRYTFLDLLKLLGFQQLTVTDGDRFSHRFTIE
ncbi:MAG: molybdopterin-guanine dinucleotide biosynthesis protein A [Gammaproteobacteria bacterium]|nr:MAG: molybdopterin-guanine dinucleotide biosynthesis protein A [Gammaproteobacteria bacterium]